MKSTFREKLEILLEYIKIFNIRKDFKVPQMHMSVCIKESDVYDFQPAHAYKI